MEYYCNECKKTISADEFFFSMNRYKKALCSTHQRTSGMQGATKDLQDLVRSRHADELQTETPQLKTIKDWINADFDTWKKVLNKEGKDSFMVKGSGEEEKKNYVKSKDK
jgi:hypothetical protein